MAEDITKITLAELLQDGEVVIEKKFVLINSLMYDEEAFAYILSKCNDAGAVVFITDKRKIYTHGEYFGGDLWEDTLHSVTEFEVQNLGVKQGSLKIDKMEDKISFNGVNGVDLSVVETEDSKVINIGYDLLNSVNDESVVFDPKSEYHLGVVDGKITIVKYTAASLYVAPLDVLEYDSGDKFLTFEIQVGGTDPLIDFSIVSNPETTIMRVPNTNKIQAVIPNNTAITFTMDYSDGKTTGSYNVTQRWGYACVYGTEEPDVSNFSDMQRFILTSNNINKTITIEQNNGKYGYFACPSTIIPVFFDNSTNLSGGWGKIGTQRFYNAGIEYSIYKTENDGLGNVTWTVKSR